MEKSGTFLPEVNENITESKDQMLFSKIKIGNLDLKNRTVLSPIATHFATEKGKITRKLIQYYIERSKHSIGLIISESNYVSIEGRGGDHRLGLYNDENINEHKKFVKLIHKTETPVCAQLHHGGSTVSLESIGEFPVSCSSVPIYVKGENYIGNIPRTLSKNEVKNLIKCFERAAWRAKECGFDAVMLHAAHGYLINQFLSPLTNKRDDDFGGNQKKRAKFILDIIRSIRKRLGPSFPIMVRLSGDEYLEGGYKLNFINKLVKWLENAGVNEINISTGNYYTLEKTIALSSVPEGFLSNISSEVKKNVNIPIGVVGRIMSPYTAEKIIRDRKADLIYFGRALIADPSFVSKIKENRNMEIRPCIACNKCIDYLFNNLEIRCSVNAEVGKEARKVKKNSFKTKKVLIIGAGPGGLEAAKICALRGHRVKMFEKSNQIGGMLQKAVIMPYKEPIKRLIKYYEKQMEILGVSIDFGKKATSNSINKYKPDIIISAIGAEINKNVLKIGNSKNVYDVKDYLDDRINYGKTVIIIGGGLVGAEIADAISDRGQKVIIVEKLGSIMVEGGFIVKKELLNRLCQKGVRILVNTEALEIKEGVVLMERFDEIDELHADIIIIAVGYKPVEINFENIHINPKNLFKIGDCVKPRSIMEAIKEGNHVGYLV